MAEEMRLQKFIALCGIASRRAAEDMIINGRISVNGAIIRELGSKVNPDTDIVSIDGKTITAPEPKVYLILNKPKGYVTTLKDNFNRHTVLELIPPDLGRLYPVGRLDYDTEGLLLMTNDGDLTYRLTHPSHEISKTYLAVVSGIPSEDALSALRRGVVIDGRKTHPAQVILKKKNEKNALLQITIHEGRNRQVRKMCEAVGHAVLKLRRVAEGPLRLGDLPIGSFRHLTEAEVANLGGK